MLEEKIIRVFEAKKFLAQKAIELETLNKQVFVYHQALNKLRSPLGFCVYKVKSIKSRRQNLNLISLFYSLMISLSLTQKDYFQELIADYITNKLKSVQDFTWNSFFCDISKKIFSRIYSIKYFLSTKTLLYCSIIHIITSIKLPSTIIFDKQNLFLNYLKELHIQNIAYEEISPSINTKDNVIAALKEGKTLIIINPLQDMYLYLEKIMIKLFARFFNNNYTKEVFEFQQEKFDLHDDFRMIFIHYNNYEKIFSKVVSKFVF